MDLLLLVCLCLLTWSGTTFGKRVIATEGSDIILPCFLNESLVPMVIIWEKEESPMKKLVFKYINRRHSNNGLTGQDEEFEGRVFHFSDKLRDGDASIRISNTKITDSGNYRCNIPGRKLFHIELVVGERVVKVAEDRDVILPCSLNNENIEGQKFVWMKGDQKVVFKPQLMDQHTDFEERVFYFPKELKNGNASIKIKNTKKRDGGNYTCIIQGKQVSFITLSVDLHLKDRTAENISGAAPRPNVTIRHHTKDWSLLQCEVRGASPQPDVQWQDSHGNTLTAEEPQVTRNGERYDVIVNVTVTKTDKYRCVVTQKEYDHQINSEINVYVGGLKDPSGAAREPYVTILHQTNDWAKLRCKVPETSPQPHVQWRDSAGNTLTESQGSGEIILDVTVTKTDYYSCVATQDDALSHQTQSGIYVYIHGFHPGQNLPGAAREPYVTILHQTNDWAKLRCKVPETLPQPHVQWRDSAGNTLTESQGSGEIILDVTVTKTDYYSCVATQDDALSHQTQSGIYVYIHDLFLKDRTAENPGAAPRPYVTIRHQTKDWSLLQCEVQGASPQPDVQWQDSDGNTLTAEEPQVTTDGERYDVIINVKVTKTDTYRCVVTQKEIGHQIKSGIYVHINGSVRPVGLIIVVTLLVVAVAVLLLLVLRAKGYIRCNKENQTPQNNEFKMVNSHET